MSGRPLGNEAGGRFGYSEMDHLEVANLGQASFKASSSNATRDHDAPDQTRGPGCLRYRFTIASPVRMVKAKTVSVGLPEGFWGNDEAPSTNKFDICQCCDQGFRTAVSGLEPMIVPPCICELL